MNAELSILNVNKRQAFGVSLSDSLADKILGKKSSQKVIEAKHNACLKRTHKEELQTKSLRK